MTKILKNALRCKLCGDVIESTYRHNYVTCKCGACAVDGGHDYLRRSALSPACIEELSIVVEESDEASAKITNGLMSRE